MAILFDQDRLRFRGTKRKKKIGPTIECRAWGHIGTAVYKANSDGEKYSLPRLLPVLPAWAILFGLVYAGLAVLTVAFQTYVRLHQCSGGAGCVISMGKAVAWSAVWPAYWPIYAAGFGSQGAMARLQHDIPADRIGIAHRQFLCRSPDLHFFGYRFRVAIKDEFGEGDVCLDLASGAWSWRILPNYSLSRLNRPE
jgi:hypothetical protein